MILVIVFEFTIYHLMYNSHQSNYVIDIVKSLSFNEISLMVFTDLVFITSVFFTSSIYTLNTSLILNGTFLR